jgi:hypothetical protein
LCATIAQLAGRVKEKRGFNFFVHLRHELKSAIARQMSAVIGDDFCSHEVSMAGRQPANYQEPCHPERSEAKGECGRKLALSAVEGDPISAAN